MKTNLILWMIFTLGINLLKASALTGIREFIIKPGNTATLNKTNLRKGIEWTSASGTALWVVPSEDPYGRALDINTDMKFAVFAIKVVKL